jgi:hypothetical protein
MFSFFVGALVTVGVVSTGFAAGVAGGGFGLSPHARANARSGAAANTFFITVSVFLML